MLEDTNGWSQSVWMDTADIPQYPPLPHDAQADVCVIGAGIAGLTCAYLLAREGRRVIVIDAIGIGAGETGRTTAHCFPPDEWYAGIEQRFGVDGAREVADSYATATALIETVARLEHIDCQFERLDGYLFVRPDSHFRDLGAEAEAALRAGVQAELLDRVPGLSFDTGPCVRYRHQAQFHPLKYLSGLAHAIVRHGGRLHGHTLATAINDHGGIKRVRTSSGTVIARDVVVATHTPFNDRVVMHTKQAAYRTYVVGLRVPRGAVPRILLWDTGDPYYYVRLHSSDADSADELLIVGGADHKTGQDEHPGHRYDAIERWTRERFPMAAEVAYRWSGEVMEPADGLAYLGADAGGEPHVQVITGDSGNGMTHCTIGAIMATHAIMGRPVRWRDLYDPARPVLRGIGEFVSEQVNTLAQYASWVSGGEVENAAEIPHGEGAILRDGMRKLAVYRDTDGALHAVSAACTHLGCVVHWNAAERSWDCPCHGSRFGTDGQVLHGPAVSALAPIDEPPFGLAKPPEKPRDTHSVRSMSSRTE